MSHPALILLLKPRDGKCLQRLYLAKEVQMTINKASRVCVHLFCRVSSNWK